MQYRANVNRRLIRRRAGAVHAKAAEACLAAMVEHAPVDTGELAASGELGDSRRSPTEIGREIAFTAEHAVVSDAGSAPHVIRVKSAKVLTDGASFFGPVVNHPGTAETKWYSGNIAAEWTSAVAAAGAELGYDS